MTTAFVELMFCGSFSTASYYSRSASEGYCDEVNFCMQTANVMSPIILL